MRKITRLLCIVLTLAICASLLSTVAFAKSTVCDYVYGWSDNGSVRFQVKTGSGGWWFWQKPTLVFNQTMGTLKCAEIKRLGITGNYSLKDSYAVYTIKYTNDYTGETKTVTWYNKAKSPSITLAKNSSYTFTVTPNNDLLQSRLKITSYGWDTPSCWNVKKSNYITLCR